MQRQKLKEEFIKNFNPNFKKVDFLAGDASFRKYERYFYPDQTLILMDAPPEKEKPEAFLKVANILSQSKLSVPKIYAHDVSNGFILLEDFGSTQFTKLVNANKHEEENLYITAVDAIIELQTIETDLIEDYTIQDYLNESITFLDFFYALAKNEKAPDSERAKFLSYLEKLLNPTFSDRKVLVHRDFMADNIMIRDNSTGINKLGIIDFQDAKLGSPTYDLVSLLEDARRDVSPEISSKAFQHYLHSKDVEDAFINNYYTLGLQRNLKIMGYFARKLIRDQDANYLKFIPRVWGYLKNDLEKIDNCQFKSFFNENYFNLSEDQIEKLLSAQYEPNY